MQKPREIKQGMITIYEHSPVNPIPKGRGLGLGCYLPAILAFWIVVFTIIELLSK